MKHVPYSKAQVRQWTISHPAPEVEPEATPAAAPHNQVGVRYGYTLGDLDRLARRVVSAHRGWWGAGDRHDQYETAWSGIAEHLAAATEAPSEFDLTAAGTAAVDQEVKAIQRHHGSDRADGVRPRYAAYWYEPPAEPWEDRLIERIAVRQVLEAASPTERKVVLALAATGDIDGTAVILDTTSGAAKRRLSRARATLRAHWYAPEAAPPMKRPPSPGRAPQRDACSKGHALTPDNITWMAPKKPGRPRYGRCRKCESERGRARMAAQQGAAA